MIAREPRHSVNFPARMRSDADWFDVSIRNMSSRGLMVRASAEVKARSYVEIHRGNQIIIGRVI